MAFSSTIPVSYHHRPALDHVKQTPALVPVPIHTVLSVFKLEKTSTLHPSFCPQSTGLFSFMSFPSPWLSPGQSSQTAATTRIGQEAHEASGLSLARDPSQLWEGSKQHVHRVTCFIKFVKGRYLNHNQLKLLSLSTPTSSLSHFPPGQWPWGGHRCVLDSTRGKSN